MAGRLSRAIACMQLSNQALDSQEERLKNKYIFPNIK